MAPVGRPEHRDVQRHGGHIVKDEGKGVLVTDEIKSVGGLAGNQEQNSKEKQKICLTKSLIENLLNSHDNLFAHKHGKEITKLIIAKDYFRKLGVSQECPGSDAIVRKLHTIYAEVAPM